MAGRTPTRPPTQRLEPRNSTLSASSHFVFQVGGNLLAITAVWVGFAGLLGVTGSLGSGWQGHALGTAGLIAALGLFRLGKRMAIDNRVMRRSSESHCSVDR
jgi:hypothetical protein